MGTIVEDTDNIKIVKTYTLFIRQIFFNINKLLSIIFIISKSLFINSSKIISTVNLHKIIIGSVKIIACINFVRLKFLFLICITYLF